ncbi:hypothetical protein M3Y99_00071700 [Aphelenchoides fujianensis]|nr:hypothetical protein M3Y99_00071700 [Aphelenchoides fujianensis]
MPPTIKGPLESSKKNRFGSRLLSAPGTPTAHIFNLSTPLESFWMELNESVVVFKHTNKTSVTDDPLSFNLSNGQWHAVEIVADANGGLIVTFDNSSSVPLLSRFSFTSFLKGEESRMSFGRSAGGAGFKGCIHNIRISSLPELSFFPSKESGVHSLRNVSHFEAELLENGELCEYKTEDPGPMTNRCANQTCGGHGRCRNVFQSFICDCQKGWTGPTCETEIDFCAYPSAPCKNGATCLRNASSAAGYECLCAHGFTGSQCEIDIDDCENAPCMNGGRCVDRVAGFECSCGGTGYTGLLCDADFDECAEPGLYCLNGGECSNLPGSYE